MEISLALAYLYLHLIAKKGDKIKEEHGKFGFSSPGETGY